MCSTILLYASRRASSKSVDSCISDNSSGITNYIDNTWYRSLG